MAKGDYIVGKCLEMCPVEEQLMRKKEDLVHVLEKGKQMVKCFTRSAAGLKIANPMLIRPPDMLNTTIMYLFNNVLCDENQNFLTIYEFIEDRIRAVKQDLFIQQPSAEQCFPILEPIIRFYAYSAYRLGMEDENIDRTLNHNHLLENLKWLLKQYEEIEHISESRTEMESLYLVLNLGEAECLMRSISLNKAIRQKLIKKCERLSLAWYIDNYIRVFKECLQLPLLHSALLCSYQLPYVRRFALNVSNSAYSSKNLTVPLSTLISQLLYNNEEEIKIDCKQLGIEIVKTVDDVNAAHFNRSTWIKCNHPPKFLQNDQINECLKNTYLPDLLLSNNFVTLLN